MSTHGSWKTIERLEAELEKAQHPGWRCYMCGRELEDYDVLGPARKGSAKLTKMMPGMVCPEHGALVYLGPEMARAKKTPV